VIRRRTRISLGLIVALLLTSSLLVLWMLRPDASAGPCAVVGEPAMLPEIPEASGLAMSRRTPDLLWSHNDSGHAAVLFAIDVAGTVHGRVQVPVRTRDWEDVSAAPCPPGDCLYVADIGDNGLARSQIYIYRMPEPLPGDSGTAPVEVFTARYTDGPHNAESLFVIGEDVFIVTRDRTGGVYRSRVMPSGSHELTFQRIGELGLAAVSDAETSRDAQFVVVRTSHEAILYRTADVLRAVFAPFLRIPVDGLREAQGEGVALDGNMLYLSSEGGPWNRAGRLIRLRCSLPR